ncbi:MAG: RagB/SusD family nutrient uptake outer membrane protein [Chitinophagaceae bacterium]|nr:MAG: RagB/SusD family nutrient uptake outer membrane protein [Chitinophagaceae bacterium]
MKKLAYFFSLTALLALSCTKLDEGIYDKQVADAFYATPAGINATLANIYNEIRGDWNGKGYAGGDRGWYDLNETSTDEMMLPTRSDGAWSDNGIWRQMYLHQWTASQEFMNNTWNWLYRSVFKSNLAVDLLTGANADPSKIAEARVARAFFYWMLMDGWGSVPFYTENNLTIDKIPQVSRQQLFDFIVTELTENVDKLSATKGGEFYGRFNKWAGYTLLAKLYLNAQVYTGTPKWNEAIAACDKIINEGGFSLQPTATYFSMFRDGAAASPEVIFSIYVDGSKAPRNIIGIRSLHGPHGSATVGVSTWNGATVHQEFVNKFQDSDIRKAQWAIGPQPGGVNYQLNISSITAAGIEEGARNTKFFPVAPLDGNTASNDFPVYRYADVLLMKAEALRRNNASGAKALVDQVRVRAGLAPLGGEPSLTEIYDERGRELAWEGHRRVDMIRFGTFLQAHDFKSQSNNRYLLFPIPGPAMAANSNLKQTPGY